MFNSEAYIGRMIDALKKVDYPSDKLEFIIIDNGSSDNSVKIAEAENITVYALPGATISKMRNFGASKAHGDVLGFVDSDCLVEPDWVAEVVKTLAKQVNIGVMGGYYGLGDTPGWVEVTWHQFKKDVVGSVSFVSAGNMAITKSIFSQLGGFDESIDTGEDWDICQRVIKAGYAVVNNPKLKVKHLGNVKTLKNIIKKERWYGRGMFSVLKGRYFSKPLVASFVFIISGILFFISMLILSYKLMLLSIFLISSVIISMAIFFTRNIRKNRFIYFIRAIPISFCYVLGRSLSIYDITKDFLAKKY